ncbi:DUF1573 domain-containing protein [soil metagenome]
MKRSLFVLPLLLMVVFYACDSTETPKAPPANVDKDSANFTTVQWIDTAVNFGTVIKGEKVHIKYTCKNTGTKPLFIYYVRPGCGCTVADYTKAAIMPGKTGEVNAEFDSNHGSSGEVHKSINVQTNTFNASPRLTFSGTVKPGTESADSTKKSS